MGLGLQALEHLLFQEHLLSTYLFWEHSLHLVQGWPLTLDKRTDGCGTLEVQVGLLGAQGKDQLLGQEGLSGQRPGAAWL